MKVLYLIQLEIMMIGMNKIILILILILLQGCSAFTVYSQIYDSLSSYIVLIRLEYF